MEQWSNRVIPESKGPIVVRQGFDGELSRTAHHPEPFESLTAPRKIEGEDRGAV